LAMLYYSIISFAVPAIAALLLTPGIIVFAKKIGAIDLPNERKIHQHPIPRLGGAAVCIAFLFAFLLLYSVDVFKNISPFFNSIREYSFLVALMVVFIVGVFDDLNPMSPGKKFLAQILAATIVYFGGFRISEITSFTAAGTFDLTTIDYPLTVLWIAGITNAFNLIDGLDGLASGVGIIAALSMSAISYLNGHVMTALVILMLAGSIAGFLRYNFHPAKIFLGDSGSLFIGFTLAVLSIHTSTKSSTAFALVIPIIALGLPIMDTLLSMIRRILFSFLPEQLNKSGILSKFHSMFMPDRKHIHHQLIALGFSHRNVVLVLYSIAALFGVSALAVTILNSALASVVIASMGLAMTVGIRQLRYREMTILSNGLLLPLYDWPIIQHRTFQGFSDFIFSVISFIAAFVLARNEGIGTGISEFLLWLMVASGAQLLAFASCGLYKGSFRFAGIGEMLKIIKACALSVIGSSIFFYAVNLQWLEITPAFLIINFYLLVSLIAGSRMSYNVLNFLFQKTNTHGRNILIYGARSNGVLTLHYILHNKNLNLHPIGFLDDDPALEGKNISGYKIFGGHWMLKRVLRKQPIDEILITSDTMRTEILNRIKQFGEKFNIPVRKNKIFFEEFPVAVSPPLKRSIMLPQMRRQQNATMQDKSDTL